MTLCCSFLVTLMSLVKSIKFLESIFTQLQKTNQMLMDRRLSLSTILNAQSVSVLGPDHKGKVRIIKARIMERQDIAHTTFRKAKISLIPLIPPRRLIQEHPPLFRILIRVENLLSRHVASHNLRFLILKRCDLLPKNQMTYN